MLKVAVLGAGVSGLTVARKLQEAGADVTVYEQEDTVGGLARSRITDGYTFDCHGGHIFNSKHPEVVKWVFSLLPARRWKYNIRNAKILFHNRFVSYPFELALSEINPDDAVSYFLDLVAARKGKEPSNFHDWLLWHFGKGIAQAYMIPYNSKIWHYPLRQMETGWMRGKMPVLDPAPILKALISQNASERGMVHSTFYYPLRGGIQTMVDAIAAGLRVRLSCPVFSCERRGNKWLINKESTYDKVINTLPLPELRTIMPSLPGKIQQALTGLRYNSLTTALFACPSTDISWLYIPSQAYRMHRVGFQSALTPYAVPRGKGGSGALEIIGSPFKVTSQIIHQLPPLLKAKRLIDSQFTKYAYVIHDMHYRANTTAIRTYFNGRKGFYLLGRWGLWNYKNMDLCMLDAFELAKRILNDSKHNA